MLMPLASMYPSRKTSYTVLSVATIAARSVKQTNPVSQTVGRLLETGWEGEERTECVD